MTAIYQPDSLRRSVWSVCIAFGHIAIYTEFNGRVYRMTDGWADGKFIEDLPTMFPGLFVSNGTTDRFGHTQVYCDFSLLPKFDNAYVSDNDRASMVIPD